MFIKFIVGEGSKKMKGSWDSIHVVEVSELAKSASYKLTSTVMLYMKTEKPGHGEMNLSGSMTRQVLFLLFYYLYLFIYLFIYINKSLFFLFFSFSVG